MKRVITAVVLIPLVLLVLLKGSFFLLVVVTALVAELAAWEYISIADAHGSRIPRNLVLIAIAVLFAAAFHNRFLVLPVIGLCSLVLLVVCSFRSPLERVLPDTAYSVFSLIYIGLTLDLPVLYRLDGRYCSPLHWPQLRAHQTFAAHEPEQELGGKRRFACRQPAHRHCSGNAGSGARKQIDLHPSFCWFPGSLAGVGCGLESLCPGGRFG
jgi:hypothetical protein